MWDFIRQNHDMIMRYTVVEGSGNYDCLVFFNVHRYIHNKWTSNISLPLKCKCHSQDRTHNFRVKAEHCTHHNITAYVNLSWWRPINVEHSAMNDNEAIFFSSGITEITGCRATLSKQDTTLRYDNNTYSPKNHIDNTGFSICKSSKWHKF